MNNLKATQCLFIIADETKKSLESPVLFLTMTDFAEDIIHSSIHMHKALLQKAHHERILDIVSTFHIQWLQAIQDVENFKKRAKDTPRESILNSIGFTADSAKKRHTYIQKYIAQVLSTLQDSEKESLLSAVEILEDMQEILQCALKEKHKCLSNTADKTEYLAHVFNEADELLNWLDKLYDYLAKEFCNVLDLKVQLSADLTKTLHQIIDEVMCQSSAEAKRMAYALDHKGKHLISVARITNSLTNVEIAKVVDKIQRLEDRIARLKNENSTAGVMALQHKAMYLGERLESLENLKSCLNCLRHRKTQDNDDKVRVTENCRDIFNHLLPAQERCRLIEKLVHVWQEALDVTDCKSMVSILSAVDTVKEVFSDDFGHFTIDKHGRKLYRIDGDDELYQLNEKSSLVSVNDDNRHVFFYDNIGRYYHTDTKLRVYKACDEASEYMLHRTGMLLKVSEIVDGVEYRYDNLGRYYIGEDGDHIYRDKDSTEEYRPDGFGNLEKIRDRPLDEYCSYTFACPMEPMVVEESKYLKDTVGDALKTCLAEVVMIQPEDPIKYLAVMLVKYRCNEEAKQKRKFEEQVLMDTRERLEETRLKKNRSLTSFKTMTPPPSPTIYDEESFTDLQMNYQSYHSELLKRFLDE